MKNEEYEVIKNVVLGVILGKELNRQSLTTQLSKGMIQYNSTPQHAYYAVGGGLHECVTNSSKLSKLARGIIKLNREINELKNDLAKE